MTTIGADPEVLLYSEESKVFVPSTGLIGGTKRAPKPVKGGAVQEDNVTAEFNVDPVDLDNTDGFIDRILGVKSILDDLAAVHGLVTKIESGALFNNDLLQHPQALESGCDPDTNVYTLERNSYPPIAASDYRFAGGHIHIGDDEMFEEPGSREDFIKLLDIFVGAPVALLDNNHERKKTYGAAGNFRYKSYGVEYRTPSNVWLRSEASIRMVVRGVKLAKARLLSNDCVRYIHYAERVIPEAIATHDERRLMEALGADIRDDLAKAGYS